MAVAGEAQFERQRRQIARSAGEPFERSAQAQPGQIAMDRQPGSLLKDAGEMERRGVHGRATSSSVIRSESRLARYVLAASVRSA